MAGAKGNLMSFFKVFADFLKGPVGNNLDNDPEDVRTTKKNLRAAGYFDYEDEAENGYITRELDRAIRTFQREKEIREDGRLYPAGETERTIFQTLENKNPGPYFEAMDDDGGTVGFGGNVSGHLEPGRKKERLSFITMANAEEPEEPEESDEPDCRTEMERVNAAEAALAEAEAAFERARHEYEAALQKLNELRTEPENTDGDKGGKKDCGDIARELANEQLQLVSLNQKLTKALAESNVALEELRETEREYNQMKVAKLFGKALPNGTDIGGGRRGLIKGIPGLVLDIADAYKENEEEEAIRKKLVEAREKYNYFQWLIEEQDKWIAETENNIARLKELYASSGCEKR